MGTNIFKRFTSARSGAATVAAMILTLTAMPMTAAAQVTDFAGLQTEIANAPADNSPTTILIGGDFAITEQITIPANRNITIKSVVGATHTLTRGVSVSGGSGLFVISGNGSLTLENIIVDGAKTDPPPTPAPGSLVRVQDYGTFTMNSGAVLRNNYAQSGGGVYVAKYGTFNMKGGEIDNCSAQQYGGGVYLAN